MASYLQTTMGGGFRGAAGGPVAAEVEEPTNNNVILNVNVQQEGELRVAIPDVAPPVPNQEEEEMEGILPPTFDVQIRVVQGDIRRGAKFQAEIAGAPLKEGVVYRAQPGDRFAVFAWAAANLQLEGPPELVNEAIAWRPPGVTHNVKALTEYHCLLHNAREIADKADVDGEGDSSRLGPRVVICGAPGSGKWTTAKTLVNYATRMGWAPTLLDCDPNTQHISTPGTVSAMAAEAPITIDGPIESGSATISYYVGTLTPQYDVDQETGKAVTFWNGTSMDGRYVKAVKNVAGTVLTRLEHNTRNTVGTSGCIMKLPAVKGMDGVKFVQEIIETIGATHVLCLGDDFLFQQLRTTYYSSTEDEEGSTSAATGVFGAEKPLKNGRGQALRIDRMSVGTGPCRMSMKHQHSWRQKRFKNYFYPPFLHMYRYKRRVTASGGAESMPIYRLDSVGSEAKYTKLPMTTEAFKRLIDTVSAIIDPVNEPNKQNAQLIGLCHVERTEVDESESLGVFVNVEFLTSLHEDALPEGFALVTGDVLWVGGSAA